MELCDVCGNEQEDGETYTCEGCGVSFCTDCGDASQLLCEDCEDDETMKRIYAHDCDRCEYIQDLLIGDIKYEVYRCPSKLFTASWIARYGDEPHEYWSMPWDIMKTISIKGTALFVAMKQIATKYEAENEE